MFNEYSFQRPINKKRPKTAMIAVKTLAQCKASEVSFG